MKKQSYYSILLFMLTLLSLLFNNKYIYLAPNLNVNIGLILYPFTFLLLVLMLKNYNIKYVKENIYICFIFILVFYFLATLLNIFDSVTTSQIISESLRNIFTPNSFIIGNTFIYYPNLILVFTYSVIFFISHYIFITIYEAIEGMYNYLLAFILAILIGFILDQMLFTPLSSIPYLIDGTMIYKDLIELMTANFIIVIFSSVIMLFIYAVFQEKRNS